MGAVVTAAYVRAMPAGLRPGSLPGRDWHRHPCGGTELSRGKEFALQEAVSPVRVLTLTVPVPGTLELLGVKTTVPIPRDLIPAMVG